MEGRGPPWRSHLVLPSFKASLPGEPGGPCPLPVKMPQPPRPPQMAVSQRTVCCRRQGGVPDLRGSGPRLQLGRMGMLSCLQRPRSGRWRALISLHTQRLRSITSRSLPSRSRAGWGGSGSGSGSAGWVCDGNPGERGKDLGVVKDLMPRPTHSPRNQPPSRPLSLLRAVGADGGRNPTPATLYAALVPGWACFALSNGPFYKLSSQTCIFLSGSPRGSFL